MFGLLFWFLIPVIDCVRDILIAPKYYELYENQLDKLYVVKSLTSIFTFGLARSVFLLVVHPFIAYSVRRELKKNSAIESALTIIPNQG